MEKICFTNIGNLKIEGIENDYVFETIRKSSDFYEYDLLNKWLPYICKSKIILDIGANLGNHTLFWSEHIDYDKIYSFEPFDVNYKRLTNNVSLHNKKENIVTINKGVGLKEGYTSVKEFHEDNYGGTTLDPGISDYGEIEIIDIDSFVDQNQLSQVDFIKIDTEGFEISVLSGMESTLLKYHPDLWVEVSHQSFLEIVQRLNGFGYTLADVEGFNLLFLHETRHDTIPLLSVEHLLDSLFYNLERVNKYYQNYQIAKQWLDSKDKKLQVCEDQRSTCQEENTLLYKRLDDAYAKYKTVLNNYETAKNWVSDREEKINELQERLLKQNEEISALQEKNGLLYNHLNEASVKYKNALDNYETAKNRISFLIKNINELSDKLASQNTELERITSQHQQAQAKVQESALKTEKMTLLLTECAQDYDFNIMNAEQLARVIRKLEIQNSNLLQKNNEIQGKLNIIDNSKIGKLGIKIYGFYKKHLRKQRK